jgi:hypothetical protein
VCIDIHRDFHVKLVSNDSRIVFLNRGSCGLVIAASSEKKKREDKRQPMQFSLESNRHEFLKYEKRMNQTNHVLKD